MGNAQQCVGKRVDVESYQVEAIKYLGEGGSSFIFLVKDVARESARPMVLKRLLAANDDDFEWIRREIEMHKRFQHPQVVAFYAAQAFKRANNQREVFILMEYCPNGHLYENLLKMGERRFPQADLLRLFRVLCVPVNEMHHCDPPVAHRDLKLENFLLSASGVYKLCDFGSCVEGPQMLTTKEQRQQQTEHVLKRTTAMYRSPELADVEGTALFGSGVLTEAVDVWAMGCVLFTLAFFKSPFPPDGLRTERYTIPKESKYSPDLHQLIARMLQADASERATMDHVIACIDAIAEGKPLPKKPAPREAGEASSPPITTSRDDSFNGGKKTMETRRSSVPNASTGGDLLDLMDTNAPASEPTVAPSFEMPPAPQQVPANPFDAGGFADFSCFPQPTATNTAFPPTSTQTSSFPAPPAALPMPIGSMAAPPPAFPAMATKPAMNPMQTVVTSMTADPFAFAASPVQPMQPYPTSPQTTNPIKSGAAPAGDPFASLDVLGAALPTAVGSHASSQNRPPSGSSPSFM